jgi:hypothetical protein
MLKYIQLIFSVINSSAKLQGIQNDNSTFETV